MESLLSGIYNIKQPAAILIYGCRLFYYLIKADIEVVYKYYNLTKNS